MRSIIRFQIEAIDKLIIEIDLVLRVSIEWYEKKNYELIEV